VKVSNEKENTFSFCILDNCIASKAPSYKIMELDERDLEQGEKEKDW
jgi:hypothetical protein